MRKLTKFCHASPWFMLKERDLMVQAWEVKESIRNENEFRYGQFGRFDEVVRAEKSLACASCFLSEEQLFQNQESDC
jgi:hypothetical protein